MQIPEIEIFEQSPDCVAVGLGGYISSRSGDKLSAIAIAVLGYLNDEYGLETLTVDGQEISVTQLLKGE